MSDQIEIFKTRPDLNPLQICRPAKGRSNVRQKGISTPCPLAYIRDQPVEHPNFANILAGAIVDFISLSKLASLVSLIRE